MRVRTAGELGAAFRAARAQGFRVVIQEEIEGPISTLRSVGLYATPTTCPATFTSQKLGQVPADFGDGLIVQAIRAPDLIPLAVKAVQHFGYHGMADIEFKWDARAGVYKLLDINPRPWLWINLPTVCGVNLPYAAYLGALGRPVEPGAFVQRDFQTRWISARGLAIHLLRSLRRGPAAGHAPHRARALPGTPRGPAPEPRRPPGPDVPEPAVLAGSRSARLAQGLPTLQAAPRGAGGWRARQSEVDDEEESLDLVGKHAAVERAAHQGPAGQGRADRRPRLPRLRHQHRRGVPGAGRDRGSRPDRHRGDHPRPLPARPTRG